MGATRKPGGDGDEVEAQREYAALGYELLLASDVLRLSRENLTRVAAGVTEVLDAVYRRDKNLSEERARKLAGDVASGRVLLFALLDSDRVVVATTAFTRVDPVFPGGRVSSFEAGRTARRPGAPLRLAARLIGASFSWAAGHLRDIDYLVAHARVAHSDPGRPYNGGILGRLLGYQFIPAHAVYSNYVAQTAAEPFVWACAPVERESWCESVRRQTISLPDDTTSQMLGAMLDETLGVRVAYATHAHGCPPVIRPEFRELTGPSRAIESLYVLTTHPVPSRRKLAQLPGITLANGTRVSAGLSDRVIVEEDITGQAGSAHALTLLRQQGFDLAGWAPSSHRYGRITLVLTRPGTVPQGISVASADLSALDHLPAASRFMARVLARHPQPAVSSSPGFDD
jgi:hypothetical protein